MSDDHFLSRWSRRKIAARRPPDELRAGAPEPVAVAPDLAPPAPAVAAGTGPGAAGESAEASPLPAIESLTGDSDFAPFMRPDVDGGTRQQALKVLMRDPRFNVMDGLDVYIDDYSQPDPMPEGWLGKLNQMAHLGEYVPPSEAPVEPAGPDEPAAAGDPAPAAAEVPAAEGAPPEGGPVSPDAQSRNPS